MLLFIPCVYTSLDLTYVIWALNTPVNEQVTYAAHQVRHKAHNTTVTSYNPLYKEIYNPNKPLQDRCVSDNDFILAC